MATRSSSRDGMAAPLTRGCSTGQPGLLRHPANVSGTHPRRSGEVLHEGADAGYVAAHDQRLHRLGALERVQRLDVRQVANDMVLEQDAVAAQQVSGYGD